MAVGPNLPKNKKGTIMLQGHTGGLYGLDPDGPTPVKEVGQEPRELKS